MYLLSNSDIVNILLRANGRERETEGLICDSCSLECLN